MKGLSKNTVTGMQSSKDIFEEVYTRYNRDPLGWFITLGVDKKNRSVVLIQKDRRLWQIKTHHISPYNNLSVGGSTKSDRVETPYTMSFGWRDLSKTMLLKIQEDIRKSGEVSLEVIESISKIDPKPLEEDFTNVMTGPFNIVGNPLSSISKSQGKLDKKLSLELDRLLLKNEGGGMYG